MYRISLFILILIGFSHCNKKDNNSANCTYDACSYMAPANEVAAVEAYLANNNITTAVKHCSGLYYRIESPGTGTTPQVCSDVAVTYKGSLISGATFDESTSAITLNLNQVITGWKNAIPLIKKGGKITLYIPPSLGYGPNQVGSIPPNSILIFTVTLVDVL